METISLNVDQFNSIIELLQHIRTATLWIFGLLLYRMFSDYFQFWKT